MEHLAFASLRAAEEVAKKAAREDLQVRTYVATPAASVDCRTLGTRSPAACRLWTAKCPVCTAGHYWTPSTTLFLSSLLINCRNCSACWPRRRGCSMTRSLRPRCVCCCRRYVCRCGQQPQGCIALAQPSDAHLCIARTQRGRFTPGAGRVSFAVHLLIAFNNRAMRTCRTHAGSPLHRCAV